MRNWENWTCCVGKREGLWFWRIFCRLCRRESRKPRSLGCCCCCCCHCHHHCFGFEFAFAFAANSSSSHLPTASFPLSSAPTPNRSNSNVNNATHHSVRNNWWLCLCLPMPCLAFGFGFSQRFFYFPPFFFNIFLLHAINIWYTFFLSREHVLDFY